MNTPAFAATIPGLFETHVNSADDFSSPGDPNLGSDVVLAPLMSQISNYLPNTPDIPTDVHIWTTNDTWIYTGQIFFPNSPLTPGVGILSFAENNKDSTLLKIDGVAYISDTSENTPVGTGPISLSAGWHDIEMRFGNGGGSAGPSGQDSNGWSGWSNSSGFVFRVDQSDIDPFATSTNVSDYVIPVDNGSGNLFRTALLPEPATASLLGLASLSLLARRRRSWKV